MERLRIPIYISYDDFLANYTGQAKDVLAHSSDGRVIRFPAIILRQFITKDGINGIFELTIDDQHRLKTIKQIK